MIIVGIDEAGRGPLAGPVVASAVIMPNKIEGIDDSKKLSAKKRTLLYHKIMSMCRVGIGIASVVEIDRINILNATLVAMKRAYQNLGCYADLVLIDGNKAPELPCKEIKTIIGGDAIEPAISAASIIAKVTRDNIMQELHKEFPYYHWQKNAGYGTKEHLTAITNHGISKHHRSSFAPIKKYT